MKLEIPNLILEPGKVYCLHIPHVCWDEASAFEKQIAKSITQEGKTVGVCQPAIPRSGFFRLFREERADKWLAHAADMSLVDAQQSIVDFDFPVHPVLSHNAGTPRVLLGIAAGLASMPDVLIYNTAGLDPRGRVAAHRYVMKKGNALCVIHLSFPTVHGDGSQTLRECPSSGYCQPLFLVDE